MPPREGPRPGPCGEQELGLPGFGREVEAMGKIGRDRRPGRLADRHQPLLGPLAANRNQPAVADQRADRQGDQLADPEPARIEQLHQGVQAEPADARTVPGGGDQAFDLLLAQQGGERTAAPGRVDPRQRVVLAHALGDQEPE